MISYIVAEVVMNLVFENYHEAFTWWAPNYYDLQQYEIEISLECKFYFLLHVGCDITEGIALVKKKIYRDIVFIKAETLYDPDSFREFYIPASATKLFNTILDSVTGSQHSTDRIHLNKKRAISFIYKSQMANSANHWLFHSHSHKKKATREKIVRGKDNVYHSC